MAGNDDEPPSARAMKSAADIEPLGNQVGHRFALGAVQMRVLEGSPYALDGQHHCVDIGGKICPKRAKMSLGNIAICGYRQMRAMRLGRPDRQNANRVFIETNPVKLAEGVEMNERQISLSVGNVQGLSIHNTTGNHALCD